ncbi:hypothetical protein C8F04DRAFT_1236868 [Mycena alexandri]|uniref:Uncharacterized protein n=1 Tax=Mycena alexandri TaxID=1745969 RepID=A0AAD6WZ23_9AGAR|nr:hypothetical protein C8F04DRAFT_1236868 [Mycena alexandri]
MIHSRDAEGPPPRLAVNHIGNTALHYAPTAKLPANKCDVSALPPYPQSKFSVWLTVNGQRGAIKIRKIALFCSDPDSGAVRTWRPCLCIIVQQRSKIAKSPYRTKGWAPSSVYCMLWHCKPLRCSSA